ncbi:MAG: hypothetical protein M1830_005927, partial [Pleopsidium flavum]
RVSEETKPLDAAQSHVRRRKRTNRTEGPNGLEKYKSAKVTKTRRKRRAPVHELALVRVIPEIDSQLGDLQDPDTLGGIDELRDDPILNSQLHQPRTTTTTPYTSLTQPSCSFAEQTIDSRKPLRTFQDYFVLPRHVGKSPIDLLEYRVPPRSTEPLENRRKRPGSAFDGFTALRRSATIGNTSSQRILKAKGRIRPLTLDLPNQVQQFTRPDMQGHNQGPIDSEDCRNSAVLATGQNDRPIVKPTAIKTYRRLTKRRRQVTLEEQIRHRPTSVSTSGRAQAKAHSEGCHDFQSLDDRFQKQGSKESDANQGAVGSSHHESLSKTRSSDCSTTTKRLSMVQADVMQSYSTVLHELKPIDKSPSPNTRLSVHKDAPSPLVPHYGVNGSQLSDVAIDDRDDWKVTMPTRRSLRLEVQDEITDGRGLSTSEREYPLRRQGPRPRPASGIFPNTCGSSPLALGRNSSPSLGAFIQGRRYSELSEVPESQEIIRNLICTSERSSDPQSNKRIREKASIETSEFQHDGQDGLENDADMLDISKPIAA